MKCLSVQSLLLLLLLGIVALPGCVGSSGSASQGATVKKQAEGHYLMGISYLGERNTPKAIEVLQKAAKLDDSDPKIHDALAYAYALKKAFGLAEQHYLKAIKRSDGAAIYYNNLGSLYLTMERFPEAIAAYEAARDDLTFQTPEIAWAGIGYAYFQQKDYVSALQSYQKSIEMNPRFAQAYFRLGELYYAQERVVEAAEAFATMVKLAPNAAIGHYWLGLTSMKTRDSAAAEKAFTTVIRLAPESEEARLSKSYLDILK